MKFFKILFLLVLLSFSIVFSAQAATYTDALGVVHDTGNAAVSYTATDGNTYPNNSINWSLHPPVPGQNLGNSASTSTDLGLDGSATFSDALSKSINKIVGSIDQFSKDYQISIRPMGVRLLSALAVISITWSGMQLSMTSGSLSEPMNKLIMSIFTIGFAAWLVTDGGYDTFIHGIDSLMNDLVSHVPEGSTVDKMFESFMMSEFNQLGKVIDTLKNYNLLDLITKGGVTILLVLVLFIGMLVTSMIGMIAVLTSLIMVAIAMAVGPIFVPFIVLDKTSFLFDGWSKFLINACLTKVVVALLLGIGMAALGTAANPQAHGTIEVGSMIGSLLAALAISGVIGYLMLSAPHIASSITSGGALNSDGFAGRMHSAAKSMGRNASVLGTHNAANKIGNLGNKVGGSAGSAMQTLGNRLRASTSGGAIGAGKPPSV